MRRLGKFARIVNNYVISRAVGLPSTASFWYLPEPAVVTSPEQLERYKNSANPSPFFLVDYRAKLAYGYVNERNIICLPYGESTGDQVNPFSVSQYALGHHDAYLSTGLDQHKLEFIRYLDELLLIQHESGYFPYQFDWYGCNKPWHSALAQSCAVSALLRGWLLTQRPTYLDAARRAVALFDVGVEAGGYLARHAPTGALYFEEYPETPSAAINGFMASMFGLWELGHWAHDEQAASLYVMAKSSLALMLPHYTTSWWTLYDNQEGNYHSPRYHTLVVSYLSILNTLSPDPVFEKYLEDWMSYDSLPRRVKAIAMKLKFKIKHH